MGRGVRGAAWTLAEALARPMATDIAFSPGVHQGGTIRIARPVVIRGQSGAVAVSNFMIAAGSTALSDLAVQGSLLTMAGTSVDVRHMNIRAVGLAGILAAAHTTVRRADTVVAGAPVQTASVFPRGNTLAVWPGCSWVGPNGSRGSCRTPAETLLGPG